MALVAHRDVPEHDAEVRAVVGAYVLPERDACPDHGWRVGASGGAHELGVLWTECGFTILALASARWLEAAPYSVLGRTVYGWTDPARRM